MSRDTDAFLLNFYSALMEGALNFDKSGHSAPYVNGEEWYAVHPLVAEEVKDIAQSAAPSVP